MKQIIVGAFLFFGINTLNAQTVDEVLAKYETAVGGKEKLLGVKQLEIFSTVKMGIMGQAIELPITVLREQGKLYRRQIGGIMGMGDTYTIVTDTAGYVSIPAIRGFGDIPGTEGSITKMNATELSSLQYELDCAGAFAELINYTQKGHSAEIVGTEKINKAPSTKVRLTLKSGQNLFYYFDNNTGLVNKVEATGEMAANITGFGALMKTFGNGNSKNMKAEVFYIEYQDIKGIKYPSKYTINIGPVETQIENTTIKVNEGIEAKWYKIK